MVEGVEEYARIVRLILTVWSFNNLLAIGTQWTTSKRNKFFEKMSCVPMTLVTLMASKSATTTNEGSSLSLRVDY